MLKFSPYTTLRQFLVFVIIAGFIYLTIRLLRGLTWSTIFSERDQNSIRQVLDNFLLLYEPLVILLLISALVGIKPLLLGPIMMILFLASYKHWRNYISHTLVLTSGRLHLSSYIHSNKVSGKVIRLGKLGLEIQTVEGIHILSYQSLLDNGYTVSEGDKISRIYTLHLRPKESLKIENHESYIKDKLVNTPYVDWNTLPEIEPSGLDEGNITLRVVLRDKSHLDEIVYLLGDWGYHAK